MKTLQINKKINAIGEPIEIGDTLLINMDVLIGHSTKSLYIRKGFLSGALFLSQRGNGACGAGDICNIGCDTEIEVSTGLFERIKALAKKANAII